MTNSLVNHFADSSSNKEKNPAFGTSAQLWGWCGCFCFSVVPVPPQTWCRNVRKHPRQWNRSCADILTSGYFAKLQANTVGKPFNFCRNPMEIKTKQNKTEMGPEDTFTCIKRIKRI